MLHTITLYYSILAIVYSSKVYIILKSYGIGKLSDVQSEMCKTISKIWGPDIKESM